MPKLKKVPYLPPEVKLEDVDDDLYLISKSERDEILKLLADKPDGRYGKDAERDNPDYQRIGINTRYSIIKHEGQYYALYKGMQVGSHAGAGSFGVVKHAQNLENGQWIAAKNISEFHKMKLSDEALERSSERIQSEALKEHKELSGVNRSVGNLPPVRKTKRKGEQYQILMKSAEGYDLRVYLGILAKKGDIHPQRYLELIRKMCEAVNGIHTNEKILHRDIKQENFRFNPTSGVLTVVDFGAAVSIPQDGVVIDKKTFSPFTIAPETFEKSEYSTKSDAFSVGAMIADTFDLLDDEPNNQKLPSRLKSQDDISFIANKYIQNHEVLSAIYNVCAELMNPDPGKRLDLSQAIAKIESIQKKIDDPLSVAVVDVSSYQKSNDKSHFINSISRYNDEVVIGVEDENASLKSYIELTRKLHASGLRVSNDIYLGTPETITEEISQEIPDPLVNRGYVAFQVSSLDNIDDLLSGIETNPQHSIPSETTSLSDLDDFTDDSLLGDIDNILGSSELSKEVSLDEILNMNGNQPLFPENADLLSDSLLPDQTDSLPDLDSISADSLLNDLLQKPDNVADTSEDAVNNLLDEMDREEEEKLKEAKLKEDELKAKWAPLAAKYKASMQEVEEQNIAAKNKKNKDAIIDMPHLDNNADIQDLYEFIDQTDKIPDIKNELNDELQSDIDEPIVSKPATNLDIQRAQEAIDKMKSDIAQREAEFAREEERLNQLKAELDLSPASNDQIADIERQLAKNEEEIEIARAARLQVDVDIIDAMYDKLSLPINQYQNLYHHLTITRVDGKEVTIDTNNFSEHESEIKKIINELHHQVHPGVKLLGDTANSYQELPPDLLARMEELKLLIGRLPWMDQETHFIDASPDEIFKNIKEYVYRDASLIEDLSKDEPSPEPIAKPNVKPNAKPSEESPKSTPVQSNKTVEKNSIVKEPVVSPAKVADSVKSPVNEHKAGASDEPKVSMPKVKSTKGISQTPVKRDNKGLIYYGKSAEIIKNRETALKDISEKMKVDITPVGTIEAEVSKKGETGILANEEVRVIYHDLVSKTNNLAVHTASVQSFDEKKGICMSELFIDDMSKIAPLPRKGGHFNRLTKSDMPNLAIMQWAVEEIVNLNILSEKKSGKPITSINIENTSDKPGQKIEGEWLDALAIAGKAMGVKVTCDGKKISAPSNKVATLQKAWENKWEDVKPDIARDVPIRKGPNVK